MVIGSVSSILVEVLMQGKILLYPKYFQDEEMLFEEMGACWAVHSYQELEDALKKIQLNPAGRPYSSKDVEKFLEETVYAGSYGKDVLNEYAHFINEVIK